MLKQCNKTQMLRIVQRQYKIQKNYNTASQQQQQQDQQQKEYEYDLELINEFKIPKPQQAFKLPWWYLRYGKHEITWRIKDIANFHSRPPLFMPPGYIPEDDPLLKKPLTGERVREASYYALRQMVQDWRIFGLQIKHFFVGAPETQQENVANEQQATTSDEQQEQAQQPLISDTLRTRLDSLGPTLQVLFLNRLSLLRNCLNQFVVGYNEGMGRQVSEQTLIFKEEFAFKQSNMSKDEVVNKVGVVARKMGAFRDELKDLADVKDDDLTLKKQ